MKVLWLSHLLPFPPQGIGVLQRSSNLLKAVAEAHEVTLLSFNQKELLRIHNPDLDMSLAAGIAEMNKFCHSVKVIDIECDKKRYGKVRLALSSLFSFLPYTIRWLTSASFADELRHALDNSSYDVIWFDTISLAQYRHMFEKYNATLVLNHHNIESDMMFRRADKENNYIKKLYYYLEAYKLRRYERSEVSSYNINVTCSDLDSRRLESTSPGVNTHVIPNGVNIEFFSPGKEIEPDPYSLVFIGGMSWYPNREAMLFFAKEVWTLLKKEIPEVSMHVVGENPPETLIELAKTDTDYHVYGFVNDVKKIFNKCGIYVCPISDGGGTKLKILDALSMGKPIVANKIACEGIAVEDGFSVLFAETPEEYVTKISQIISDSPLRKKLSKNSRQLILDRYTYAAIGKDLIKLLEKVVK